MYIPKHFLTTDRNEIVAFMKQYSFATIVTAQNNLPIATHLPFVVSESGDEIVLTSHFAKANSQWTQIADNNVLIIFAEPHAYISPKYYNHELSVPTWNYIAIHVYGTCKIIAEQEKSFAVLDTMINCFEKEYKSQWDILPIDFKLKMLNGIVPFEITVTDVQAKKKLSQNKKPSERQKIISAFENSSDFNENRIADFMKRNDDQDL